MKQVVLPVLLVALTALLVNGAIAMNHDPPTAKYLAVDTRVEKTQVKKAKRTKLVLPNIPQLTRKLLAAERPSVQRQLTASRNVIAFFENPKRQWLRAPRREKCWEVPWQRSCTIARASYKLHLTLATAAQQRLWRELPLPDDWVTAVRVIQRVFPGTESWLLSCSDAEGGHGRWVRFGGGPYYAGYEYTNEVGNWMQYRWGTFKGHYRNGLESLRQRGFVINMPHPSDVRAWLMPMGAAIAAGWARWSKNDDAHWSASWGSGC